jgi:chorismate--pyruvate lyase
MPLQRLRAAWHAHLPYDASIPLNQRRWITGEGSLTARLMSASSRFRVRRLAQAPQLPFADEWQALGLIRPLPAITREVLLICDETPAVFAHTIVDPGARRDWPFLRGLGNRPLGGALFVDPRVRRDPFQFARLTRATRCVRRCSGYCRRCRRCRCCPRGGRCSGAAAAPCS